MMKFNTIFSNWRWHRCLCEWVLEENMCRSIWTAHTQITNDSNKRMPQIFFIRQIRNIRAIRDKNFYELRKSSWILVTLFLIGCTTPQPINTVTPPTQVKPTLTATAVVAASPSVVPTAFNKFQIQEYPVPKGAHPHDVAPDANGNVWYTAQATGELGKLNAATGEPNHI